MNDDEPSPQGETPNLDAPALAADLAVFRDMMADTITLLIDQQHALLETMQAQRQQWEDYVAQLEKKWGASRLED
jgi:hypothetical protein